MRILVKIDRDERRAEPFGALFFWPSLKGTRLCDRTWILKNGAPIFLGTSSGHALPHYRAPLSP